MSPASPHLDAHGEEGIPSRLPRIPSGDSDAPAARLAQVGARALSTRELLCLLLTPGRGSERALDLATALGRRFTGPEGSIQLRDLAAAGALELARVPGIGAATAARLLAAVELGRRIQDEHRPLREPLRSARDVYDRMRLRLRDLPHEEFWVLLVNVQNEVQAEVTVTRGILDATTVHPREVFRSAIQQTASAVVLVHNHPSGEPTPSSGDKLFTRQLASAGITIGIPVIDHVIVGEARYFSFAEAGLLDPDPRR